MKVQDIMRDRLLFLPDDATLQETAKKIEQSTVSDIVVLKDNQTPSGILTQDDILGTMAQGYLPDTSVSQVQKRLFGKIFPHTQVATISEETFDRWLVYDGERIVGLVHRSDFEPCSGMEDEQFLFHLDPVFNCIDIPAILIDTACRVTVINDAACAEINLSKKDCIGKPITDLLEPTKPETFLKNNDLRFLQKFRLNGKTYVTNWAPIRHHGKMVGCFAVLRDMTDYESMSNELDRITDLSKELNAIIDSSFDGIFVTDGESTTLKINKAYQRITGIKNDEVVGKTMTDLVLNQVFDESVTLRVLQEKKPVTIVQHIMKTGKTVVVTGNPVFDDNGNIFRVVTNVRDVTELNLLQEKLNEMEKLQSRYEIEIEQLRKTANDQKKFVIKSRKMKAIYELALKLAVVDSTVLIQGDSGVGKEVFSEIIHRHGSRRNKPFVKISCAAIPENLLESELFGYVSGAFTGASREGRAGIFELANGGTIFLDEIGEMPMNLQVKLLRVLQEREIVRIGGSKPIKVDIRIMAATNRDLEEMIQQKQFRKDLFFRLNVVPVIIPPLCERKEAITHFVYFFLKKHNQKYGFSKQIASEAMDALMNYNWPGNVRELENMVEQLIVMARGEVITAEDLPGRLRKDPSLPDSSSLENKTFKVALEEFEYRLLRAAVEKHGSSRKVAAALGIHQSTVVRKVNRFGIPLNE